ncbi:MAG: Flp pilus assembly complex ATPase component TadA [Planctomycetes bacterium]|nr:Flp pilus assembly complex ATPase component TadA [Planctomycetota bacterium]
MSAFKKIGQILKEMEVVSEGQIQEAIAIQKENGGPIGRILIELGYISADELLTALAAQLDTEVIDLEERDIPPEVINKLTTTTVRLYRIMPVSFENNVLTIVMADPMNIGIVDELKFMLNCEIRPAISSESAIDAAIEKFYGQKTETLEDILKEMTKTYQESLDYELLESKSEKLDLDNIQKMAHDVPVVKLLNLILYQAIKDHASDIHFEPFETEFKVRYRVDGFLVEMQPPPKKLALPLISRIKVLAGMDISETRLPQDGRIALTIAGRPVDLRISTLPTYGGESVVMRVLDRSSVSLDVETIGFRDDEFALVKDLIELPSGIIVVTGPTGHGKTTTLYACLNHLNDIKWKIITTENPVEFDLPGIMQCQINEEIGVTYPACLKSILRQDPDIILVGEIRDFETADMAIEASLTGHVVLTTLHSNDAPSTVTRLLDLGAEPYLITATIEAVIAQRLVRKVCSKCKELYEPTEEELMELNISLSDVKGKKFARGKGCSNCNSTGYRGRIPIFEIMLVTERIKDLIVQHASTEKIRQAAVEQGMRTLRESGLLAIFDGTTTIAEVVKETQFTSD